VRKLTEEFFAGAGREREQARTIFAVGDEKQSIFSFQGADPGQFDINRRYFADVIAGTGQRLHEVPLITSRRSARKSCALSTRCLRPKRRAPA